MRSFLYICLFLLTLAPVKATQMIPLSIEQLSDKAEVIVRGVVTSKLTKRIGEKGIYTQVELKVEDSWKGATGKPHITIAQAGGVLGETIQNIPGQAVFKVGEEVVIFGVWNQRQEAVVLGLSQGKFNVAPTTDGKAKHCYSIFHGRPESTTSAKRAHWKPPLLISNLKTKVTSKDR